MEVDTALVRVSEPTDASEARRRAALLAQRLAFDELAGGRLAIVVTEAATNLLKHAGGGEIFLSLAASDPPGVQVIAMDRGGGIADVERSLADGFSTAGSSGTGLGAIRRAAASLDVHTTPGGTVLAATVYPGRGPVTEAAAAGIKVPAHGEQQCGDDWAAWSAGELSSVFVCDGLGHGPGAAEAARRAVETFGLHAERAAADVVTRVHDALKGTRGAAVALAELDRRQGRLRYCAIGNISAVIARPDGSEQHLATMAGIAGHAAARIHAYHYDWPTGSLLVMHTDGVGTRWSFPKYPGLSYRRPEVVAGVLYRDHKRGRDDATVVVSRNVVAA